MWDKLKVLINFYIFKRRSYVFCQELPYVLDKFTIYLVEDWMISFRCPCGCNKDIHLNTLDGCHPCWNFVINNGNVSIYPSIKRRTPCKSHFWIKNGKVVWCYY